MNLEQALKELCGSFKDVLFTDEGEVLWCEFVDESMYQRHFQPAHSLREILSGDFKPQMQARALTVLCIEEKRRHILPFYWKTRDSHGSTDMGDTPIPEVLHPYLLNLLEILMRYYGPDSSRYVTIAVGLIPHLTAQQKWRLMKALPVEQLFSVGDFTQSLSFHPLSKLFTTTGISDSLCLLADMRIATTVRNAMEKGIKVGRVAPLGQYEWFVYHLYQHHRPSERVLAQQLENIIKLNAPYPERKTELRMFDIAGILWPLSKKYQALKREVALFMIQRNDMQGLVIPGLMVGPQMYEGAQALFATLEESDSVQRDALSKDMAAYETYRAEEDRKIEEHALKMKPAWDRANEIFERMKMPKVVEESKEIKIH